MMLAGYHSILSSGGGWLASVDDWLAEQSSPVSAPVCLLLLTHRRKGPDIAIKWNPTRNPKPETLSPKP